MSTVQVFLSFLAKGTDLSISYLLSWFQKASLTSLNSENASRGGKSLRADQGPVVQSMVSLTSSLRGQLLKCFTTLQPNTLKFFVDKNERSFCTAKASHIFSTKNIGKFKILTFEILTKRYLTTSLVLNNRALFAFLVPKESA